MKWYCRINRAMAVALALAAGLLCCGAGAVAAGAAEAQSPAERELKVAAGPGFELLRSEHFVLAYDTEDRLARSLIKRLEATYQDVERFCATLDLATTAPQDRLAVILFAEPAGFRAYAERLGYDHHGSFGFYYARTNRSAFFDSAADPELTPARQRLAMLEGAVEDYRRALRESAGSGGPVKVSVAGQPTRYMPRQEVVANIGELTRKAEQLAKDIRQYNTQANQMLIQHEGSHQVLYNVGVHAREGGNPQWLLEGLACLFEPPPISGTPGLAGVNQFRLYDLRKMLELPPAAKTVSDEQIERAVADGRFIPLAQLIGDGSVFASRPEGVWPAYAEAWALAHYLYAERPKDLAEYIRRIAARPRGVERTPQRELDDFTAIFGPLDERFRRDWLDAIVHLPAPNAQAELKQDRTGTSPD